MKWTVGPAMIIAVALPTPVPPPVIQITFSVCMRDCSLNVPAVRKGGPEACPLVPGRCEMPHGRKSRGIPTIEHQAAIGCLSAHAKPRTLRDGPSPTVGTSVTRSSVKPNAIEPKSILAKELLAVRRRHFRGSLLEAAVEVIPRAFEAVHGKIRGKHTSFHAKDPDCVAKYRPIGRERPRLTQYR